MPIMATLLSILTAAGGPSLQGPDLFPEMSGWRCVVDTSVYVPSNLWDLIDGAAESYLMYGFVDLHIAEYTDETGLDVRVEVYRHSNHANAFGIYAAERYPDYDFIEVGTQGYAEEGILNFLTGEFYVKLSSHSSGPENALLKIASAMDQHLGRPRTWPDALLLLPREGRLDNTEAYTGVSYLGHTFLRGVYSARYGAGSGVQLFVMEHDSPEHVSLTIEKLRSAIPCKSADGETYRAIDPNNGPIMILKRERFLYGVVGASNTVEEEAYIALLKSMPQ